MIEMGEDRQEWRGRGERVERETSGSKGEERIRKRGDEKEKVEEERRERGKGERERKKRRKVDMRREETKANTIS